LMRRIPRAKANSGKIYLGKGRRSQLWRGRFEPGHRHSKFLTGRSRNQNLGWAEAAPEATTSEFTPVCPASQKLRAPTAHKSPLRRSVVPPFLNRGIVCFEKIRRKRVHSSAAGH
jgi:hypothetical protein